MIKTKYKTRIGKRKHNARQREQLNEKNEYMNTNYTNTQIGKDSTSLKHISGIGIAVVSTSRLHSNI